MICSERSKYIALGTFAALLLAVLLLTGCVPYVRWQITTNIPQTQQMPAPTPAPAAPGRV